MNTNVINELFKARFGVWFSIFDNQPQIRNKDIATAYDNCLHMDLPQLWQYKLRLESGHYIMNNGMRNNIAQIVTEAYNHRKEEAEKQLYATQPDSYRIDNTDFYFVKYAGRDYNPSHTLVLETDKPNKGLQGSMQILFSHCGNSVIVMQNPPHNHGVTVGSRQTTDRLEYNILTDEFTSYERTLTKKQRGIYENTMYQIMAEYAVQYEQLRQYVLEQRRIDELKGQTLNKYKGVVSYGFRLPRNGEIYLLPIDNHKFSVEIATHNHSERMQKRYILKPVYTDEERELIGLQVFS